MGLITFLRAIFGIAVVITLAAATPAVASPPSDYDRPARIRELIDRVTDDDSFKVRAYAARELGAVAGRWQEHKNERDIVIALRDALSDRESVVRSLAAVALGHHGARDAISDLQDTARHDSDPNVREAAFRALRMIDTVRPVLREVRTAPRRPRVTARAKRVELGTVLAGERRPSGRLIESVRSAVEDMLEPHRPAIFPREDPDARIDVTISRIEERTTTKERHIKYEARAVVLQLPGSSLRHTSLATAVTSTNKRGARALDELEHMLAIQATTRAVNDVLGLLARD